MRIIGHFNDIEKNIRRNNAIVRWLIILFCVMTVCFTYAIIRLNIYYSDKQLILESDGEVRKIRDRITRDEALTIECKHHINMLYGSLYTMNQFNFEKQIEAAYWLGDESIRDAYRKYKNQGWYDQLLKDNIEIEGEVVSVDVDLTRYPYPVTVQGFVVFRKGFSSEKFILDGTCLIKKTVRNYPHNPHGLFIMNWNPQLKEIKN
ncbi:MAG: hypothetical protein JXB49_17220 [Bacteroidales bacterium]|nr:hypothetical protein [Bacteroidales bacterium]